MSNRLKHVDDSTTNPFPVYSLEGLEWWLKRQPADETYYYESNGNCMIARYLRSRNYKFLCIGSSFIAIDRTNTVPMPDDMADIAVGFPHTFGAALSRVRQALA
jgi:hypothetical protein